MTRPSSRHRAAVIDQARTAVAALDAWYAVAPPSPDDASFPPAEAEAANLAIDALRAAVADLDRARGAE